MKKWDSFLLFPFSTTRSSLFILLSLPLLLRTQRQTVDMVVVDASTPPSVQLGSQVKLRVTQFKLNKTIITTSRRIECNNCN